MSEVLNELLTKLRTVEGAEFLAASGLRYAQIADAVDIPKPTGAFTVDPIKMATIDDLFNELSTRCKSVLLVAEELRANNAISVQTQYAGGIVTAMGLAQYAINDLRRTQKDMSDENGIMHLETEEEDVQEGEDQEDNDSR